MGVTFRTGTYLKRVKFGKRTVKEGEAVAIWDYNGAHRKIIGPKLVRMVFATIRFLDRYVALPTQYLVLELPDGSVEHRCGPCDVWHDPVEYRSVKVVDALQIVSANECIVVYDISNKAPKRILNGPKTFFPTPSERIFRFKWATRAPLILSDDGAPRSFEVLVANNSKFEADFCLSDGSKVILSLIYSLDDVMHIVENQYDVHDEIISGLRADLVNFPASKQEMSALFSQPIEELMRQLPFFRTTCSRMRLSISSLRLLSMELSRASAQVLEAQKAAAAELKAEEEKAYLRARKAKAEIDAAETTAQSRSRVADIELAGESERAAKRHALEQAQLERSIALREQKNEAERKIKLQGTESAVAYLGSLKALGVDLTQVVCEALKHQSGNSARGNGSSEVTPLNALAKGIAQGLVDYTELVQGD